MFVNPHQIESQILKMIQKPEEKWDQEDKRLYHGKRQLCGHYVNGGIE